MVQDKVAVAPRLENASAREKSVVLGEATDANRVAVDALQNDLRIVFNGKALFLATIVLNPLKATLEQDAGIDIGLGVLHITKCRRRVRKQSSDVHHAARRFRMGVNHDIRVTPDDPQAIRVYVSIQ